MRHDRKLRVEPFHVLGLTLEVALGDEQREVDVLGAGGLDPPVLLGLHVLPEGVCVGANDHRPAHRAVVRQLRLANELLVPLGEVLGLRRQHGA